jgi:hypothetical protein
MKKLVFLMSLFASVSVYAETTEVFFGFDQAKCEDVFYLRPINKRSVSGGCRYVVAVPQNRVVLSQNHFDYNTLNCKAVIYTSGATVELVVKSEHFSLGSVKSCARDAISAFESSETQGQLRFLVF